MDVLQISGTHETPEITLDAENNRLEFSGSSLPENVFAFYQPVLDWIDEYLKSPNPETTVVFKMEYFNTTSSKLLLDILMRFDRLSEEGKEIKALWHYREDDIDLEEAGEEYSELINYPMELVPEKVS